MAELLRLQQHGTGQQLSMSAPASPAARSALLSGTFGSEALRGRKREDSHLKPLSLPDGLREPKQQATETWSGPPGDNLKRKAEVMGAEGREQDASSDRAPRPSSDSAIPLVKQPVELDLLSCFAS